MLHGMSRYLDTRGRTTLAVAICDRCRMKRPHDELQPDPNTPSLMVCQRGCADSYDPYRLPPRQPENIALRFCRPDTPLTAPDGLLSENDEWLLVDEFDQEFLP